MSLNLSTSSKPVAGSTEAKVKPPLDDIMLAMDVVDTLRRRERLVKKELDEAGREQDLKERLRRIYAAQGIEVPDQVIEQGVAALKEERFTYQPPPPGLTTRLARLYVSRDKWGKWFISGVMVLIIAWLVNYFVLVAPNAALPQKLTSLYAEVVELAKSNNAQESAKSFLNVGTTALRNEDSKAAKKALAALEGLRIRLEQEYTIRIVNRPGERSGVWRVPDINTAARNYYIVVEAVSASGKRLLVPIKSEETNNTMRVDIWALRVDQEIYSAVGNDKQDDGIIERDLFGVKSRGYLAPEYKMNTTGGAITEW